MVKEYSFREMGAGRTGLGIMVKTGRGWKVPDQWAGTDQDNFVTQSLSDFEPIIEAVVKSVLHQIQ